MIDENDEELLDTAAATQADYDTLVSSLRQRVSELEAATASSAQRNPFQTPTVRLQPTGRGAACRGRALDLNTTPHQLTAAWLRLWRGRQGLHPCYRHFAMAVSHHVRTRLSRRCRHINARCSMLGALMGGGSSHPPASNPHSIRVGVRKTDKSKKLPMDNEFSTMEHLAKAQAGYIRQ